MERTFEDVLEIYNGRNQRQVENPAGKYPIYGSGGVMGYADDYICPGNTVVIGRKGSINKPIFVTTPFWNVDTAFGLVAKPEYLLPKYLYYFCEWFDFEKLNTTVTIPSLTKANLFQIHIHLPSMEDQQKIVQEFEAVESLISHRQDEIHALDQLIKVRFVELFGELKTNEHGYPVMQLGDLVTDIIAGWSANGESRIKKENEKAVLKVSAVTQGFFKPDEHKALADDLEIKKYVYPHKGDMLFSRANTRELVGATAIIEQDYPDLLLPDKLWRVLFSDTINVYYAKYALSMDSVRQEFSAQSTGTSGSMFNVSAEKFKSIRIPVPPIELQKQFAAFVSQVDKSKLSIQASLDQLETLKQSLMQKYFG